MEEKLQTLVKRRGLLSLIANETQSHGDLTAELERSKRTISRYLQGLEQLGVVRRRGSQTDLTTLGRWYVEALDTLFQFSRSVHPVIERSELSPDRTPPYWALSACQPISSPSETPYSSMNKLRERLTDAESVRIVAVTLTPSLTRILSWAKTETILPADLQSHLHDQFGESGIDATTVSNVEMDVNILVAETTSGYLTAFTLVTNDGSHTALVTDDVDVSCWANGWIDRRLAQA